MIRFMDLLREDLREAGGRPREAAARVISPRRPEGVAHYRCMGTVPEVLDAEGFLETPAKIGCGAEREAAPHAAMPECHGLPMALVSYDWDRDVT